MCIIYVIQALLKYISYNNHRIILLFSKLEHFESINQIMS